ncbi:alcohol dehydrogenase catalytic domain-containing protein [Gordonia sp. TBRC 11910]|uniref:Alcohol dehydrogenase catalytic domain-containing protein n=1 Tax=Gordonia asplenii TaxID=2725283 RepID=A0A848KW16_9ACTN|nr:alcohol dehydrogenase catalytic domain-containing protein [Gordonia asplenii]NMN99657.1 alcohol dehydrogenase catalytic domain-containing protein [Gordonia asplenii]
MRAVIYEEPGVMRVGEKADPTPLAGEAVVKVGAVGICGSDLNIAAGLFPPTPFPITPGHEFAGEIVALGAQVDYLRIGDRVAVDPSLFCGHCRWCRVGRGNLCENWGAIGDTVDGAAAEFVVVPARNCHHIPESMSFAQAAAIEPLSCAVHATAMAPPRVGESILVVGGGTMGLLTGQLYLRGGARRLALVERKADRRPIGAQVGFTDTFAAISDALSVEPAGFDLVIDATGVPAAIEEAFGAIAKGGRFVQVGVAPPEASVQISPYRLYYEEITVVGSMAVLDSYAPALDLIAGGLVNVDALLTHCEDLDDYPAAFETLRRGEGLKIQLTP